MEPTGRRRSSSPGLAWFLKTFQDPEHDGWLWIVDKDGRPLATDKIMYGQSFVIYSMSECALATGNARARGTAEHTFDLVQKYAAETAYGGYREMFLRDWQPRPSGAYGGDRKSIRRAHAPHGSLHDALRAHPGRDPQEEAPGGHRGAVVADVRHGELDGHLAVQPRLHPAARHHVQDRVGLGPGQRGRRRGR